MKNISLVVILIFTISFAYSQDTLSTELFKKDYLGKRVYENKKAKKGIFIIKNSDESNSIIYYSFKNNKIEKKRLYKVKDAYEIWMEESQNSSKKIDYSFKLQYCIGLNDVYLLERAKDKGEFVNSEPIGGIESVLRVMAQVNYPQIAVDNNIEGKVYISIVVNEDGTHNSYCILRGVHPLLDKAAMSQVMKIGNFKPATLNGKKVKSTAFIPVVFKLG